MQPADSKVRLTALAVELRRRSPWEATDLGLAMLQRWWRPVYTAHALVVAPLALVLVALGWAFDAVWAAMLVFWWLEPLYDRVVLHVLSRAVFGEIVSPRSVFAAWREWTRGLIGALTLDRFDMARSFNLPVRQLEGSRGREARERRRLLGRRARGQAVWLTVVWIHFEGALLWSAGAMAGLLLPVGLERTPGDEAVLSGLLDLMKMASVADALIYAAVIVFLEPFYVAAGFGLYLNRRTLLEGWDVEVALRRIAERHAAALLSVLFVGLVFFCPCFSDPALAQQKNPKEEIAEVLKAPEFGHYRETTRWERIDPAQPRDPKTPDLTFWHAIGFALAKAAEAALWVAAIAAIAYALWWLSRRLPRAAEAGNEAYQPPPALFGMELAPDTLPAEVPEAAARLAAAGKLRDALSLLYRGALSELVHKRGVRLLASHTEGEAVRLAGMPYFAALVDAWLRCAYARRLPSNDEVEQLTKKYREAFA
ncbi:MAG TPA: hypothetical protein VGP97_03855 [Burkholderiales bacterium]|nr:hypothetical protein [Burkholderiales bacterium]